MGLFGKSRPLKDLESKVLAGRLSLEMYDRLPPANQERTLVMVPSDIRDAAARAAAAGHSDAARQILVAAQAQLPDSSVGDQWPGIIDSALGALQ